MPFLVYIQEKGRPLSVYVGALHRTRPAELPRDPPGRVTARRRPTWQTPCPSRVNDRLRFAVPKHSRDRDSTLASAGQTSEGVLANFFNSLLTKKSGTGATGTPGGGNNTPGTVRKSGENPSSREREARVHIPATAAPVIVTPVSVFSSFLLSPSTLPSRF